MSVTNEKAEKLIAALKKRGFDAYYAATKAEAAQKALSLIPAKSSVSWGGSVSVEESGLLDKVRAGDFVLIDRSAATTGEERIEMMRKGLLADVFLTSFNAVSEDGVLFNIEEFRRVFCSIGTNISCCTEDNYFLHCPFSYHRIV